MEWQYFTETEVRQNKLKPIIKKETKCSFCLIIDILSFLIKGLNGRHQTLYHLHSIQQCNGSQINFGCQVQIKVENVELGFFLDVEGGRGSLIVGILSLIRIFLSFL